jgi:3-isopropylmalate dehydrogenase
MGEAERIVAWINGRGLASIETETDLVGGCAYDAHGQAISEPTMTRALAADAVMLGAVGGPKWDGVPYDQRPEAGLLRLRKDLALFANLRPAICYAALANASSLKRDLIDGLDIMIVRELTGGIYFGEPRRSSTRPGQNARWIPRSTTPMRSSALPPWLSILPASASGSCIPPTSATS